MGIKTGPIYSSVSSPEDEGPVVKYFFALRLDAIKLLGT